MIDTKLFSTDELEKAANIIKSGGTVIFPTETVYGLGADAMSDEAVRKIFLAKGRPSDNPLIVHIADFNDIYKYVKSVTGIAKKLADAYWPGPMTLILEKKACISDIISAGLKTVGIRIPADEVARKFLQLCELPVAAPSANLSGSPSPTTAKHVIDDMMGRVDGIIQGQNCEIGIESTVIDVTGEIPVILRPGGITPDMVKAICGDVIISKDINGVSSSEKPKSPGMKYKHYAPKAEVILIEENTLSDLVKKMLSTLKSIKGKKIVLCTAQTEAFFDGYEIMCLGDRENPETIAQKLFDAFRECDEMDYESIILEGIPESGIGLAVMNRAHRAAKK